MYSNIALETARELEPPTAKSKLGGDIEGSEWWLNHEGLMRKAWDQWNHEERPGLLLPPLDEPLIDPTLREAVDRTKTKPTSEHEAHIHELWEEVISSSILPVKSTANSNIYHHNKVYRYPGFLTTAGVRNLRRHLDAISRSGIPNRRPNSMNRNGLLLDPNVSGGVSGDLELHRFIALVAQHYLRPLGRSLFPEFAGDSSDDAMHYAFTIQYGAEEEGDKAESKNGTADKSTTDWDLKEHSDSSLYTLNINLNLPEEDYSGSSIYFVAPCKNEAHNATDRTRCELSFKSGTALLHRGLTRHGAKALEGGRRSNLVIWLHGTDGYVRFAPYPRTERMSLEERWVDDSKMTESSIPIFEDKFDCKNMFTIDDYTGMLDDAVDLRSVKNAEL